LEKEKNKIERDIQLVPTIDNLLFYEITIERQLYRAIAILRRLKGWG